MSTNYDAVCEKTKEVLGGKINVTVSEVDPETCALLILGDVKTLELHPGHKMTQNLMARVAEEADPKMIKLIAGQLWESAVLKSSLSISDQCRAIAMKR